VKLNGGHIIAAVLCEGKGALFSAVDPAENIVLEPHFHEATPDEIEQAVAAAASAFDAYRNLSLEHRARFLDVVAEELNAISDDLIERAH
jgi:NADP-dependent aldehyde dehydrogenase